MKKYLLLVRLLDESMFCFPSIGPIVEFRFVNDPLTEAASVFALDVPAGIFGTAEAELNICADVSKDFVTGTLSAIEPF